MKPTTIIPAADLLASHELAALEIGELRRKGVPCHLEERADGAGHRIAIVRAPPDGGNPDAPPERSSRGCAGRGFGH